jgi:hypothetical protein
MKHIADLEQALTPAAKSSASPYTSLSGKADPSSNTFSANVPRPRVTSSRKGGPEPVTRALVHLLPLSVYLSISLAIILATLVEQA